MVKARQHDTIMCTVEILRMRRWHAAEKLRKNMQEHGRTTEDKQERDQGAAPPTQYTPLTTEERENVAQKWQLVANKPRWTQHHQVHQSPSVTEVARCTEQRVIAKIHQ